VNRAAMTVLGPVPAAALGHVQMHEHLLCDLSSYLAGDPMAVDEPITLDNAYAARVDRHNLRDHRLDDADLAVAELELFAGAGGTTVVEVSSIGLGRDPLGLRRIAERTGVRIVMGCGYYVRPCHPPGIAAAGETSLARRIVADLVDGVDETGVRAGIIGEIGMSWPPHPDEVTVLRAAAIAQAQTGAALLVHPGRHPDAPAHHLQVIAGAGGDLTRTVMSHVDRTLFDPAAMLSLACTGCVLAFDLFGTESCYYPPDPSVDLPNDGTRITWIKALIAAGHGDQVVIAQDVCRKSQLTAFGGEGYAHILRRVLPLMRVRGITAEHLEAICVRTPARLLLRPV
jgi:phosphotriesterase-related protein